MEALDLLATDITKSQDIEQLVWKRDEVAIFS